MAGQNPSMVIRVAANIAELKANLAEGRSQIETTTAAMGKMVASFSGDKLIQAAHNVTAAVHQIGGASKLTEAEQARVNATVEKALDKYRALGKEAPAALQKLADDTRKVESATTLADKAAGFLKSTFAQFTLASLASSAIQSLVGQLREFIAIGMALPAVEASFHRLTAAMNVDSGQMLATMTAATKGLVSNYDLMLGANKAMLLGLPVTASSMGELAAAATTLGRAMGKDAKSSLDDLITALGRSSPMILDNLGLTVKVGEANEAYAEKLGKSASQLTDAEKKMAFYEAAMEAARRKTVELGEQTKTLGEIMLTAWTHVGNVASETVATLNVGIGAVVSSGKNFAQFLQEAITLGTGTAISMAALREEVKSVGGAVKSTADTVAAAVDPLAKYRAQLAALETGSVDVTKEQRALILQADKLGQSISQISTALNINEGAVKRVVEANKNLTKSVEAAERAYNKLMSEANNANQLAIREAAAEGLARQKQNEEGLYLMKVDAWKVEQEQAAKIRAQQAADADALMAEQAEIDAMVKAYHDSQMKVFAEAADGVEAVTRKYRGLHGAIEQVANGVVMLSNTFAARMEMLKGVSILNLLPMPSPTTADILKPPPMPRAMGGPVSAGSPYMVGERGPELFVPRASGTIVPNGGGMSLTVNVDARESFYDSPASLQRLGDKVGAAVIAQLRHRGAVAG